MEPIKLEDGTTLIPLDAEEKAKLEAELAQILTKYNAIYLPVVKEEKTLTNISYKASLFLLKKQTKEILSPIQPNAEPGTTEETTKAE